MNSIYDFQVKMTNGEQKLLQDYNGRPLIIVNTASKCGFAPQFGGLQELYSKYQDQGLVILGFPSAQFNNQEYDNMDETTQFCQINYGVTFPIFAKIDVNGEHEDALFTYLKQQQKGMLSSKIKWNFTKFLVDRDGKVVKRYSPRVAPSKIEKDLIPLL
ncbi:glutathione peroxidase [Paenibacillus bouchesdurhonensis]|uniref:glutathione peroxidase n=1 Tax=Paenibacillus bouchesdurhonensis TaxID=1870990 RepID=UPI000DA5F135|nr:glutathione peroxidase [Paenibacillus bouchesdurhonensis]